MCIRDSIYGGWKLFSNANRVWVIKTPYLRTSYQNRGKPITKILKETLPNTAILALSSMFIAIILGIFFSFASTSLLAGEKLNKDYYPGEMFEIQTVNNSPENVYVNKMQFNGKSLKVNAIKQSDIIKGGLLLLNMEPNSVKN